MKKVCYKAVFGAYDNVLPPKKTDGWEYIIYTDQDGEFPGWKVKKMEGDVKTARRIKITAPFDHDIAIWCDGNIQPNCDLDHFVLKYHKYGNDLALMNHPGWNCIYKEAQVIVRLNKDIFKTINAQANKYKEEGYPAENGLVQTGIMVRMNTKAMKDFAKRWWKEVKKHSHRDQMSFNYCMWKKPINYNLFTHGVMRSEFNYHRHEVNNL